jgi:glycosyltransferase involved in cell wall biosynthesis
MAELEMRGIVLINQYAGPESSGPLSRTTQLAREWAKMGIRTVIVCGSFVHTRKRIDPSNDKWIRLHHERGVLFLVLRLPAYRGNGIGRILNTIVFVLQSVVLAFWIRWRIRPDAIVCASVHGLDILSGTVMRTRAAVLAREVRDLWPLTLIEMGGFSKWNPAIVGLSILEKYSYRKADAVFSTLDKSDTYMCGRGLSKAKWAYMPQSIEQSDAAERRAAPPNEIVELISNCHAQRKMVVAYTGSHGISNALTYFLQAASLVASSPIEILLIGDGPEKENLQHIAHKEKLINVHFFPAIGRRQVCQCLELADVGFIGWRSLDLYRFGISPNKLLEYMLAGLPVIHSTNDDNDLVKELNCGFSVPSESPVAIADAMTAMYRIPIQERLAMGQRGKNFVLSFRTYSSLAEKYYQSLARIHRGA